MEGHDLPESKKNPHKESEHHSFTLNSVLTASFWPQTFPFPRSEATTCRTRATSGMKPQFHAHGKNRCATASQASTHRAIQNGDFGHPTEAGKQNIPRRGKYPWITAFELAYGSTLDTRSLCPLARCACSCQASKSCICVCSQREPGTLRYPWCLCPLTGSVTILWSFPPTCGHCAHGFIVNFTE